MENMRILIVDDNEISRKYLKHLLTLEGYTNIIEASNGHMAIDHFKDYDSHPDKLMINDPKRIDMVILDIMLGDLMGYEVCEAIKKKDPLVPVICISCLDEYKNEMRIINSGADAFELKPIDPSMFSLRVKKLMEKRWDAIRLKYNYESIKEVHKTLPAFSKIDLKNVDGYQIDEICGSGSSSRIYRCRKKDDKKVYALKILNEEMAAHVENIVTFREEIENLVNIKHDNIIKVYDHGIHKGFPYFVMDYIEGQCLSEYVKDKGSVPLELGYKILNSMASALDYIHTNHIIHRDIKLENIIMSKNGNIILTDFGLSVSDDRKRTSLNGVIGTPLYIAPEVIVSRAETIKWDVYSLGVAMYYLLTGQPPYSGISLVELIHQHCSFVPPRVDQIRADLPKTWGDIIESMLDKNPDKRPKSITQVINKLDLCA